MPAIQRRSVLKASALAAAAATGLPGLVRAQSAPLKIGLITPLSGPQEFIGSYVKNGADVAIEQINKGGGILGRQVQLEIRDDKANPAAALAAARELLGAGVNLHTGGISSAVVLALGPVMQQEKGVFMTCGAGTEKMNHENYSPNLFRPGDAPDARTRAQAKLMAQKYPDITRWTGLVPDHEYGRTTWSIFVDALLEFYPAIAGKKPTVLEPILMPYGVSDYRNSITQALRQQADGVFNCTYGGDAITMFQQARGFGLMGRYKVVCDAANEFLVARGLKQQLPAQWTGMHYYAEANKGNAMSDRFVADYAARTRDSEPLGWAAEAHASLYAYKQAIEKAKSAETEAVIAALKGLTWDTVTGPRTMRAEDNQAIKDVELVYLEPAATDKGYKVSQYVKVDGKTVIFPPTPGRKLTLRTA
ncbi:ABC transporter substrate-binding protein [Pseudorhodoferax soli]|uniref:Amino acid/amide ABC transporter substrate-binding protein (HAAT family) n=1 Tax=Pseudorhodoferax soli TaxID=545864 RepID=A0A368XN46_9BURK|nr:ABC transporter substrate-binding protein [Pseudorhodoferax soli]RCW69432.1 amino acid/amide ABC transporter substrate-binding protein (HAAT family) [Pseudorhodoferax soli]